MSTRGLHVEDHPDPLAELRLHRTMARAYRAATDGDKHMIASHIHAALATYQRAAAFLTDSATNGELAWWGGVTLADQGRVTSRSPSSAERSLRTGAESAPLGDIDIALMR